MEINQRQKEILETEAVAVGTTNRDGSPNVIAVGFVKVVSPDEIVITDNFMKTTPENIKKDPRICLAVWTKDWEEGYQFSGKAEYFIDGKWLKFVKEIKENKDFSAKGAIVVKVDKIKSLC